jgi:hypothetical protein
MTWTLKKLLDYETGDSWNGTHFRDISAASNSRAGIATVNSDNQMHPGQIVSLDLSLDELKEQIKSGEVAGCRYFGDFAVAAHGVVPDFCVEGARDGAFFMHVDKVYFAGVELLRDIKVNFPYRFKKPGPA